MELTKKLLRMLHVAEILYSTAVWSFPGWRALQTTCILPLFHKSGNFRRERPLTAPDVFSDNFFGILSVLGLARIFLSFFASASLTSTFYLSNEPNYRMIGVVCILEQLKANKFPDI